MTFILYSVNERIWAYDMESDIRQNKVMITAISLVIFMMQTIFSIVDKLCSLTSYDSAEWNDNIKPTVDRIIGTFPVKENEIMLSEKDLQLLDIENPSVGMEIKLAWQHE